MTERGMAELAEKNLRSALCTCTTKVDKTGTSLHLCLGHSRPLDDKPLSVLMKLFLERERDAT